MSVSASQPSCCVSLTFHGVGEPVSALVPGERDVWISERQFVATLDAVRGRDGVLLSFDDGNASDMRHAPPELQRRDMRATSSSSLRGWDSPGSSPRRIGRRLSRPG